MLSKTIWTSVGSSVLVKLTEEGLVLILAEGTHSLEPTIEFVLPPEASRRVLWVVANHPELGRMMCHQYGMACRETAGIAARSAANIKGVGSFLWLAFSARFGSLTRMFHSAFTMAEEFFGRQPSESRLSEGDQERLERLLEDLKL